jgi:hypothetical protein
MKYYLFIAWPCNWGYTRNGSSLYARDISGCEMSLSFLVPITGLSKTSPCTELTTQTYYECVKYKSGHLEEALAEFYRIEGIRLVEVPKAQRPKPEILQPFASLLWSKKETVKNIRIFVAEDVPSLT